MTNSRDTTFGAVSDLPAASVPLSPWMIFPSLAFEFIVRVRNGLYDRGWLTARRLPAPVISVGNLTMGGSGKTPLIGYLAQALCGQGYTPVILSRGYGRSDSGSSHIIEPGSVITEPASTLGDEPALLRRCVPAAWLGIAADRYAVGRAISERLQHIVYLLDDGFQHRRVHRDLDIVIIDRTQPLISNRLFPRGSLREPSQGLRRSQLVIINGTAPERQPDELQIHLTQIQPEAAIFHCIQKVGALVPFPSWSQGAHTGVDAAAVGTVFLVAAIGNPQRFRADIDNLGLSVCGMRFFRDHARLKRTDWSACVQEARHKRADAILVTEKDAIKVESAPDFPLLVALQCIEIAQEEEFKSILTWTLGRAHEEN